MPEQYPDFNECRILSTNGRPSVALMHVDGDEYWQCALRYGQVSKTRGISFASLAEGLQNEVHFPNVTIHKPRLRFAQFHPRIARVGCLVRRDEDGITYGSAGKEPYRPPYMKYHEAALRSAHVASLSLYDQLEHLLRTVEPNTQNAGVFGHGIRQLLLLAATEVESAWKGILVANEYDSTRTTTNDYVKLADVMRLREWEVRFESHDQYPPISPFGDWDASQPTQSLSWYNAYNTVKHDREGKLHEATFAQALSAMAAVAVMGWAQFGQRIIGVDSVPHTSRFVPTSLPLWSGEEAYFGPSDSDAVWSPVPCPI